PLVTHSRPALAALLEESGLAPRRDLGQNFVVDPNTVRRIADLAAVGAGDHVVEVGAGLGSLTLALAETGAFVTAVEVDRGIAQVLRRLTADVDSIRVVEGDAMNLDWGSVLEGADSWTLVANLPYNIATPLIVDLLVQVPRISRMLVMVQLEAAERFAAGPGSGQYGAVSVRIAHRARARIVGHVPPTVFLPRPKVDSALVAIERHAEVRPVDEGVLDELLRAGFGQRRKMLRRSLSGVASASLIGEAGIDPTARPETLGLEQWYALTDAVVASR
ncbi:MAG: 16S rRNA (adenine(1518)-N(6)/adenine(1519)-N(6))-dimethyltransferase RsmA, partial [Ilumatobacteraceae bacterium]